MQIAANYFGEGLGRCRRVQEISKVVKNFDNLHFLLFIKLYDIPFWKFSWVVLHGLIDFARFNSVKFCNMIRQNHLLVAQGDDLFFYFGKQISIHSLNF